MNEVARVLLRSVDPFLTPWVREERSRMATLASPMRWGTSVAVVGLSPHAGASTLAALLVDALIEHQGERVLAIDADPACGLRDRFGGPPAPGSAHQVLVGLGVRAPDTDEAAPGHVGYRWLRQRLARAGRVNLLASDADRTGAFMSAVEYAQAVERLRRWFRVLVTETSAKRYTPALPAVVRAADRLVLVASNSADGLAQVSEGRHWIETLARETLTGRTVCVLIDAADGAAPRGRDVRDALGPGVVRVARDAALAPEGRLSWPDVSPRTRQAVLAVAAAVAARPVAAGPAAQTPPETSDSRSP